MPDNEDDHGPTGSGVLEVGYHEGGDIEKANKVANQRQQSTDLLELHRQLADAGVTIARLEEQNEAAKLLHDSATERLQAQLDAVHQEQSQSASLNEVIEEVKQQVDRLSIEVSTDPTSVQNHALRRTIVTLRDEIQGHKGTIRQVNRDYNGACKTVEARDDQIDKLKEKLEAASLKETTLIQAQKDEHDRVRSLEKEKKKLMELLDEQKTVVSQVELVQSSEATMFTNNIKSLEKVLGEKTFIIESMEQTLEANAPKPTSDASTQTMDPPTNVLSRRVEALAKCSLEIPFTAVSNAIELRSVLTVCYIIGNETSWRVLKDYVARGPLNAWVCLREMCRQAPILVVARDPRSTDYKCSKHGQKCTWGMIVSDNGVRKFLLQ
ncbi:hypothetical protein NW762_008845 [Fusarium torreyae]|uniref:Uncharacterized protein n=1 Tax=Fusarium torreyae TaxID=1237075 RepID=A0A9W8RX81_9HYPO|nr:hypothetical protein NW762_008845 [Fusarium torreyae]